MAQSLSYLTLDIVMTLIALALLRKRIIVNRRVLVVLASMLIMTAVFDNAMIACHLFTYNWSHTVGLRIVYAPIEDFFYPLVGTFLLTSLWEGKHARTTQ